VTQDLRATASATLAVENVGGIDETTVEFSPGVTALVGPNATNRTSLLQAVAGALGSDRVTLKGDAEEGQVTLLLDGETYTRRLTRQGDTVTTGGDPYLDDPALLDLYAVLLEDNEVRRAVRRGENLRELIMRPVDTEAIQAEISTLVDRRQEVHAELDRLDALAEERREFEADRRRLESELEELEAQLAEKREARAELEADESDRSESDVEAQLDARLASLRDAETELERVERELEVERKSLASLREERSDLTERHESLEDPDDERLAVLGERIENLRERKTTLESTVSELRQVVQFNQERLAETGDGVLDGLEVAGGEDDEVTDQLVAETGSTTCWTCGSVVERSRIDTMVGRLRDLLQERNAERRELADRIADLVSERDELRDRLEERDRLETQLAELETELERREENVAELTERREEYQERVEELERRVEELQAAQQDELLTLQQEVSELTYDRDRTADRLADVESSIEDIEADLETREELEAERESISAELTELRTRIERIETQAVERFNTHMEAVLDELGYDNVERIWIESVERQVSTTPRQVSEQTFELHVVRRSSSGTTYEDRVDHLSESERELVGLVVALAGYLVHDVQESVPFMLLDSLEMIDGDRLVRLVDYLRTHVPFLVVVLLPDHARAFDDESAPEHRRLTDI